MPSPSRSSRRTAWRRATRRSSARGAIRTSVTGRTEPRGREAMATPATPPDPDRDDSRRPRFTGRWLVVAAVGAAVVTLGLAALLTSIFQRKAEALDPFVRVVEVTDTTQDPAV